MRTTKFLSSIFVLMLSFTGMSKAEDIDIYSGLTGAAGVPNVMMLMDTGANFSSNASPPCTAYADGGAPSLGGTGGGVEQCALVDAISALPEGKVNIGIMVNNGNNFTDGSVIPSGQCLGSNGGCLVWPLALMTAANKSALITFIKSWQLSGANSASSFTIKSGGDRTGSLMQETWAYYRGKTGLSGKTYSTDILTSGCQKNFIIDIGNSFSNSGGPADTAQSDPDNSSVGLESTQVAATAAQKVRLTDTVKFPVTTCGDNQKDATTGGLNNWSYNWFDEWARYMHDTDASPDNTGDNDPSNDGLIGTQNITTYTIGVINNGTNSCKSDYPALLTNGAKYGGGKYFQTGNVSDLTIAILKILNEVQAVNSVFASSSLPVSVNTQGTFLNQVFIGMFRPDANASPRWLGNLKQYQFLLDTTTGAVSLGDSIGKSAISSAGTGFINPNAISYWTCGGASSNPNKRACDSSLINTDPASGFWVNQPQSVGGTYDLEDGELVEKGGAAQILRLANLQDDYTKSAGTANTTTTPGNPRKLYTYCPSGSSCVAALSNSANSFDPTNVGISATAFGSSSTATISNITIAATGTATITTTGAHGFTSGSSVTISGASPTNYNGTYSIASVPTTTTFTISGYTVTPISPPAANIYQAAPGSSSALTITSMGRTTNTSNSATETVTVTTSTNHNLLLNDFVTISGVSGYNGNYQVTGFGNGGTASTVFKFNINVSPRTPSTGTYTVALSTTPVAKTLSSLSCTVAGSGSNKKATVAATTSVAHGYNVNDYVTIAGAVDSGFNGSFNLATVASTTTFTYVVASGNSAACPATSATTPGTVIAAATSQAIAVGGLTRDDSTSKATATIPTANRFATGDVVNIVQVTAGSDGSGYAVNSASITCTTTACTSFTYPITITPSSTITLTGGTAQKTNTTQANITSLTRSGSTATAVLSSSIDLSSTSSVTISNQAGFSVPNNETNYVGTFTATCTAPGASSAVCTTFTYPVTIGPANSTTGSATSIVPPNETNLVNWVRGQDNYGDEVASPGSPVTVRPSIHGDVLHSRPVVINYGGKTGVVAFYGANDGVFRAVNANQANPTGSALPAPGSELWGFIPTEFYGKLDRQRTATPQLSLPSTPSGIVPTPQPKDYFADGATGVYQEIDASGTTTTAQIFITMRRGGKLIYALNVLGDPTNPGPTDPKFMWKISNATTGFSELGQTWSRPKTAKLKGYANTVLIFGAGYSTSEDSEPPGSDSSGRGIYIVDAGTGALVWSATFGTASACSGSTTQATCTVAGMDYSIPSDISLIDKNGDGKIDRLYAADTGGNVWRVDLEPTSGNTPNFWQVTKLAALGCSTGVCASGTTPRKFFFQPDLVPASGFDAVIIGSGDREHPLISNQSYNVANRLYVLSDPNTGNDGSSLTTPITEASLFNATSSAYAGTLSDGTTPANGFYIALATGEKVVNAPATIAGFSFFGTNQPVTPSTNTCGTNLGIARGYRVSPYTGNGTYSSFDGGGLPPTPVYGLVEIPEVDALGNPIVDNTGKQVIATVPFCIGCGGTGANGGGTGTNTGGPSGGTGDCATNTAAAGCIPKTVPNECGDTTPLEACKAIIDASTDRHRNYWYIEKDQ